MSKFTTRAITETFMELLQKKSLDKITVKDIIEEAQINRNTFYYHYEDIYDLLDTIFAEKAEQFISEVQEEHTFYDQYVRAAGFFIENKEAITHIYNSKSREVLHRYLESTLKRLIEVYLEQAAQGTKLSQTGKDYIAAFYTFGIVGATMEWVEKGMPDYRDGLMRTICDSFYATIQIMIDTYIKGHPQECR